MFYSDRTGINSKILKLPVFIERVFRLVKIFWVRLGAHPLSREVESAPLGHTVLAIIRLA
jgi:hypothetical protein